MPDWPDRALPPTVRTVTPETTVAEAAFLMASHHVGTVIVVEDMVPVGMVTDRDLVVRVLATGLNCRTATVRSIMSRPLVTITLDQSLAAAVALMAEHGIRRLPIVDEGGRLASILTLDDLLLLDLDHAPELVKVLRRQLRDGEPEGEPPEAPAAAEPAGQPAAAPPAPSAPEPVAAAVGPMDEPTAAAALTRAAGPAWLNEPAAAPHGEGPEARYAMRPAPPRAGSAVAVSQVARATVIPPTPHRHRHQARRFGRGGSRWTGNLKWFLAIVALAVLGALLVWLMGQAPGLSRNNPARGEPKAVGGP